jgi:hypothetical protein
MPLKTGAHIWRSFELQRSELKNEEMIVWIQTGEANMSSMSSQDDRAARLRICKDLSSGMSKWIKTLQQEGWVPFYVNFMFASLPGNKETVLEEMRKLIEKRFYGPLCRQFAHHPEKPSQWEKLPRGMLFADLPVPKRRRDAKMSIRDVKINHGGLHMNGVLMMPPVSKFKDQFVDHIRDNHGRYTGGGLDRIHVKPLKNRPRRTSRYIIKTVERGGASLDDYMVLPRALPSKTQPLTKRERALRDLQSRFNVSPESARKMLATSPTSLA